MHGVPQASDDNSLVSEESQSPLWTWLVLCDDSTSIYPQAEQVFNSIQTLSFLSTKILEPSTRPMYSSLCETILIVS